MIQTIKVSIITVSYNSSKTIHDTIESVLGQDYPNIEYIIIDGQSSDNTLEIIKSYQEKLNQKLSKFILISEKDNGIYDAMNKGIQFSSGEIIGIINSDDYYHLGAVSKIVNTYVQTKKPDILHGRMNKVFFDKTIRNIIMPPFKKNHADQVDYTKLKKEMIISHPACFVKRQVYIENNSFDDSFKIAADYDLILRLYKQKYKFVFVNEFIADMRIDGLSHSNRAVAIKETMRAQTKNGFYSISSLGKLSLFLCYGIFKKFLTKWAKKTKYN